MTDASFWKRDLPLLFKDYGQTASWSNSSSSCQVSVIFDNEYLSSDFLEASVATRQPQVWIETDQLETVAVGDTLVVDDTTYYVMAVEPDGTGLTRLVLSKDQT